ncbi:MAG: hypothetical protein HOM58_07900 [Rhodospirillaceae bacterium]|jgi:hypothetical protein|nr:hypothetical protein [Rhodospirillaceae bacterium]MBT5456037.1 hypothetical protein [Rhodospirillaceae bacterium]
MQLVVKPIAILAGLFALLLSLALMSGIAEAKRNTTILGCWGDADKGDSVDLKLHFVGNGLLVQYDENQVEKRKRGFGAWEMEEGSTFLSIYWPSGLISRYHVKRIGPILHFSGMNGVRNFTVREIAPDDCWEPRT